MGFLGHLYDGVYGSGSGTGVYGKNTNGNFGKLGTDDYGVYGRHNSSSNYGYLGSNLHGVYGKNTVVI